MKHNHLPAPQLLGALQKVTKQTNKHEKLLLCFLLPNEQCQKTTGKTQLIPRSYSTANLYHNIRSAMGG